MAKKDKYVPIVGITGTGEDYNIYVLSFGEMAVGFVIGFAAGFIASFIMFKVWIVSLIMGAVVGVIAVPVFRSHLNKKRKRQILLQFRDVLDALSNSFSAGRNTADAFSDVYNDMKNTYGEKAPMVKEMSIVVNGLYNNFVIEDLLKDMAKRCGIDDINSFADTFSVSNRLGGNLKKVVSETRDIISDKIEIEMEIETTVASNKNELNVMCIMPFIVIGMMGMMGNSAITSNTPTNVVVKIVAIIVFVIAYIIGRKITDIKV